MNLNIEKTLIITDMDGTFLSSSKKISEKDKQSIKRFQDFGGKFSIATGRGLQATEHFFGELNLTVPIIMCNGALIYDVNKKEEIWSASLPVSEVIEIARDVFNRFSETGGEIVKIDNVYVPRMNEHERNHIRLAGVKSVIEAEIDNIPAPWQKVLFANSPEQISQIEEYIKGRKIECAEFVRSSSTFYEILPKNATKGSALVKLKELCGFDDYTIIAAGDFYNDIDMLKIADISYAPCNAENEVKNIVDVVLPISCEESVVSHIIDNILK